MSVVGRMLGLGGAPAAPKMAPVGLLPALGPQVDAGAAAARDRQRALAGMTGTILTGGSGDESRANTSKKTLLGQ